MKAEASEMLAYSDSFLNCILHNHSHGILCTNLYSSRSNSEYNRCNFFWHHLHSHKWKPNYLNSKTTTDRQVFHFHPFNLNHVGSENIKENASTTAAFPRYSHHQHLSTRFYHNIMTNFSHLHAANILNIPRLHA